MLPRRLAVLTAAVALSAGCSSNEDPNRSTEPATSPEPRATSHAPNSTEITTSAAPEPTPTTESAPPEPEVHFESGGRSKRGPIALPNGTLPEDVAAEIHVTGHRTYDVTIPSALANDHVRCHVRAADDQNDRLSWQVSTQAGLVDDEALDEDEYSLDDEGLIFTTQSWSEGSFRRVFSSVYTSADDERLYVDEDQNGMSIDNPRFRYDISADRRTLRIAFRGLLIDAISLDTGYTTVTGVVRCPS